MRSAAADDAEYSETIRAIRPLCEVIVKHLGIVRMSTNWRTSIAAIHAEPGK
jgi:hypothetical protein